MNHGNPVLADVIAKQREAVVDHGVDVDQLLIWRMTTNHRAMTIDNLCGEERFILNIGHDLARIASQWFRPGVEHRLKRLGVVDDSRERLCQLMSD